MCFATGLQRVRNAVFHPDFQLHFCTEPVQNNLCITSFWYDGGVLGSPR